MSNKNKIVKRNPNEMIIRINDKEIVVFKNSNKIRVDFEVKYLSIIVWDKITEEVELEIKKVLK